MGMNAEVLAIGPFRAFRPDDLDYGLDGYEDVGPEDQIINRVALARTTNESHLLAVICCVEPWDLGAHKVERIQFPWDHVAMDDWIGSETVDHVVARLSRLLEAGCELWYRPNG